MRSKNLRRRYIITVIISTFRRLDSVSVFRRELLRPNEFPSFHFNVLETGFCLRYQVGATQAEWIPYFLYQRSGDWILSPFSDVNYSGRMNPPVFISTFRRLDSVSVFRWALLRPIESRRSLSQTPNLFMPVLCPSWDTRNGLSF
jgi:hypothetical protein